MTIMVDFHHNTALLLLLKLGLSIKSVWAAAKNHFINYFATKIHVEVRTFEQLYEASLYLYPLFVLHCLRYTVVCSRTVDVD